MRLRPSFLFLAVLLDGACASGDSPPAETAGDSGGTADSSGSTASSTGSGAAGGGGSSASTGGGTGGAAGGAGPGGGGAGSGSGGAGGSGGFPGLLDDGPWIFGLSGGLDHYSWVRFDFVDPTKGSIAVLDAQGPSFTPYFQCEGTGLFTTDPALGTAMLQLPGGCNMTVTFHFDSFGAPMGFPANALVAAKITVQGQGTMLDGYQYAPGWCDAAFTSCMPPF